MSQQNFSIADDLNVKGLIMTNATNKIYLKDYQRPKFEVKQTKLLFQLFEEETKVEQVSQYLSLHQNQDLILNGENLQLVSIEMNGQKLNEKQYTLTNDTLTIYQTPESFELKIQTLLLPQKNTSLEGLYKSGGHFVTQCEAEGFRKITYFMDRPDVMTKYLVTIEADHEKYPILLSNGDRISSESIGGGRHRVTWQDPHKKPCYLFALFAGNLGIIRDHFTTKSGRKVNLEVYATHGKQHRCHHAMQSLKLSMKWDEEKYGLEYDLNDYMIVAIDDFNAGAMENKGLNIFNSRLVLADIQSATDQDFFNIESVVAHEYFHNWTGNRVTLCNWFQLSLKEGLTVFRDQEFSADVGDRGVQRINDVNSLRSRQFVEDAGPNAHPVRPDSCMAVDNFFTSTIYEKGAEVIRMMQNIVGKKGFRLGMETYFQRHDGQAVATDDFAAAIFEPNKIDFHQFKRWYTQAGTPKIKVLESYQPENKLYQVTLQQSCPATPGQENKEPFHIPFIFALLDQSGNELKLNSSDIRQNSDGDYLMELKDDMQTFSFRNIDHRPVLSLGRNFSAPVNYDWEQNQNDLYFLMNHDQDGFNRQEAGQKLYLNEILRLLKISQQGEKLIVDEKLLNAMNQQLISTDLKPAMKALILELPDSSILAQHLDQLDPENLNLAIEALKKSFAKMAENSLLQIYEKYHNVDVEKTDAQTIGTRKLKNLCLDYLSCLENETYETQVKQQFLRAQNMTDKISSFSLMVELRNELRQLAIQDFFNLWHDDALVMNKWFQVQALANHADTFNTVKELYQHSHFNRKNPNNVYALLRSFSSNIYQFHRPEVYSYFADRIIEIDEFNPQVAARLCDVFNLVKKLNPDLQAVAKAEVQRILRQEKLSNNTRELLIKV